MLDANDKPAALPVLSLLLGATLWGVFWYPLRLLEGAGLSGLWTTLLVYAGALMVGAPWAWRARGDLLRRPRTLLALAAAAGWCNAAFILAILDGHVVRVLLLFYLSPVWTLLAGWAVLGERPDRSGWVAFALALGGAAGMLWSPETGLPWPRDRADWLALSSGFAFALSNVAVRGSPDVAVVVKTVVSWAGVLAVAVLGLVLLAEPLPQAAPRALWAALALGAGGMVLMTHSVQYGVTHMPVHRSAVILLFELVAGALSAALLTDERVLAREWLGGALVVGAAWVAAGVRIPSRGRRGGRTSD